MAPSFPPYTAGERPRLIRGQKHCALSLCVLSRTRSCRRTTPTNQGTETAKALRWMLEFGCAGERPRLIRGQKQQHSDHGAPFCVAGERPRLIRGQKRLSWSTKKFIGFLVPAGERPRLIRGQKHPSHHPPLMTFRTAGERPRLIRGQKRWPTSDRYSPMAGERPRLIRGQWFFDLRSEIRGERKPRYG